MVVGRTCWTLFVVGLLVGWMGFDRSAEGYLPPAKFLLKQALKKRITLRTLTIRQRTTHFRGKQKVTQEERLYIRIPGRIRQEVLDKQGKTIFVRILQKDREIQWTKGGSAQQKPRVPVPRWDLHAVSLAGSGLGNLFTLLRRLKVNYRGSRHIRDSDYRLQLRVSLALHGVHPVIVFGAPFHKRGPNQYWMDKRTYTPARFLGTITQGGPRLDVRFWDYFTTLRGPLYPGRIEEYHNDQLILRTIVYHVRANRKLPASLFTSPQQQHKAPSQR